MLLHQRNSKERRKELKPLRRVKKKGVEAERRLDDEPETVTGLKLFPCCWCWCSFNRITVFCHNPPPVTEHALWCQPTRPCLDRIRWPEAVNHFIPLEKSEFQNGHYRAETYSKTGSNDHCIIGEVTVLFSPDSE